MANFKIASPLLFFILSFSLICNTDLYGQPEVDSLLKEDFDQCSASIPVGWSIIDLGPETPSVGTGCSTIEGDEFFFDCTNGYNQGSPPAPPPGFSGCQAKIDDDNAGPNHDGKMCLVSPVVDINNTSGVDTLNFDWQFFEFGGVEDFVVEGFNGIGWSEIFIQENVSASDNTTVPLSAFSNSDFQVRFCYDDEGAFGWGLALDNIYVYGACESSAICKTDTAYLDATGNVTIDSNLVYAGSLCGVKSLSVTPGMFDCSDISGSGAGICVYENDFNIDTMGWSEYAPGDDGPGVQDPTMTDGWGGVLDQYWTLPTDDVDRALTIYKSQPNEDVRWQLRLTNETPETINTLKVEFDMEIPWVRQTSGTPRFALIQWFIDEDGPGGSGFTQVYETEVLDNSSIDDTEDLTWLNDLAMDTNNLSRRDLMFLIPGLSIPPGQTYYLSFGSQLESPATDRKNMNVGIDNLKISTVNNQVVTLTLINQFDEISTCVAELVVVDTVPPDITVNPADVTITLDTNSFFTLDSLMDPIYPYSDVCGADTFFYSQKVFGCDDLDRFPMSGDSFIVMTATDIYGNASTAEVNIVLQRAPLEIECPDNITWGDDPDECTTFVPIENPRTNGSCLPQEEVTVFGEDFNDCYTQTPPPGWSISGGGPGIPLVGLCEDDMSHTSFSCSGGYPGFGVPAPGFNGCQAVIDDDNIAGGAGYSGKICIVSPEIDLSDVNGPNLRFDYQNEVALSFGEFSVDGFDGTDWSTLLLSTVDAAEEADVSLAAYTNPDFQIRFCYDDEGEIAWGAAFDNVNLYYVDNVRPINDYNMTQEPSDTFPNGITTVTFYTSDSMGMDESCSINVEVLDSDGDGWTDICDCEPGDPDINPGADEICGNGIDDNCDGNVDDVDGAGYCCTMGSFSSFGYIDQVGVFYGQTGCFNPSGDDGGYGDYTDLYCNAGTADRFNLYIVPKSYSPFIPAYIDVWMDWDKNGIFEPWNKIHSSYTSNMVYTTIFIPPDMTGSTRMRVRLSLAGPGNDPCGDVFYGEVEDYTISFEDLLFSNVDPQLIQGLTLKEDLKAKVYPNPVSDMLQLEVSGLDDFEDVKVEISNTQGSMIREFTRQISGGHELNEVINTSDWANGTYFIQVIQGDKRVVKRVVKI